MTIKEVAEKYDISADTLRYYERVGMIPKVTRRPNGIRDYQESDLGWVELAICMRSAGLPIEVMIEKILHQRVVGQDEAVSAVARAIRRARDLDIGTNTTFIHRFRRIGKFRYPLHT